MDNLPFPDDRHSLKAVHEAIRSLHVNAYCLLDDYWRAGAPFEGSEDFERLVSLLQMLEELEGEALRGMPASMIRFRQAQDQLQQTFEGSVPVSMHDEAFSRGAWVSVFVRLFVDGDREAFTSKLETDTCPMGPECEALEDALNREAARALNLFDAGAETTQPTKLESSSYAPRYKAQPCPKCGGQSQANGTKAAVRYRKCSKCDHRWTEAKR
ncbi:MAG TPA: hypothetical protein PJ982_13935 [Lacipirellulaceae bacterium]|nr:hypothetical protein [Lacipirellulaceae bacterium]